MTPSSDDSGAPPSDALFTDLYQLTMLQAYWRQGMTDDAVFSLYYRSLPEGWSWVLAAGLDTVLDWLERLRFTDEDLEWLAERDEFSKEFAEWLRDFRFTGEVRAVPEGTPVFPDEPLLEVRAPIAQAQLVETAIMNQLHLQTVLASRAARVVRAAGDAAVVDFGMRRMHGTDAALKGARAFHIAGVAATSNVRAGRLLGVPVTGTMAHSYIQAHDDEYESFRAFAEIYPSTILLVDTYDTIEGVRQVVRLAEELGDDFQVSGIRLDSGDLQKLAFESRQMLDDAGLGQVQIFASGGLDEHQIAELVRQAAPIDGYGVGTRMGVSRGASALDIAYKLVWYSGEGRLKLSTGKKILPGPKQIFRVEGDDGRDEHDLLAAADEEHPGRPLLRTVMRDGRRVEDAPAGSTREALDRIREHASGELERLPARCMGLSAADPPFEVRVSDELKERQGRAAKRAG